VTGRAVDPVVRFLGPDAASGGPFALLGVPATSATPAAILRATDERMRRIDAHPEAGTPDADEVRLAVHAAAARLLDASTRRVLFRPVDEPAPADSGPNGSPATGGAEVGAVDGADGDGASPWPGGGVHLPPPIPPNRFMPPGGPLDRRPVAPRAGFGAPRAATSLRTAEGVLAFRRELAAAIALSGGWNTKARRRLQKISVRRGISVRALAIAARASGTAPGGFARATPALPPDRPGGPGMTASPPPARVRAAAMSTRAAASVRRARRDPAADIVRVMLGGVGVVFVGALMVLIAFGVRALNTSETANTSPEPPAEGGSATAPESPRVSSLPEAPAVSPQRIGADGSARDLENPEAAAREIAAAIDALPTSPRASSIRFASAVDGAASAWPLYAPDALEQVLGRVLDYVHASSAGDAGVALLAIEAIASPAEGADATPAIGGVDGIVREAWAIGVLTRLRRERDFVESVLRSIERPLVGWGGPRVASGATFGGGAAAALRTIGRELADGRRAAPADIERAWAVWADAADAAARDPALRAALYTDALTALLTTDTPAADATVEAEVIAALSTRIPWRDGTGAREWLLETLVDDASSGPGLAALTRAIARDSGAEGVDATLVASASANAVDRRELRDRYAEAWGLAGASGTNAVAARWTEAARRLLAESAEGPGLASGARAAVLARLNAAAAAAWRGDDPTATDLLDDLRSPVDALAGGLGGGRDRGDEPAFPLGGEWAQRYLEAERNIVRRLELLDAVGGRGRFGAVDGDVLAREALIGVPRAVRDRAFEVAIGPAARQPALINGVLEALPAAPATARTVELIAELTLTALPPARDPAWRVAARRALVERLLELIASDGPLARADGLSVLIAEAYAVRLDASDVPEASEAARSLADRHADELSRTLASADPLLSSRAIDARRDARLGMSRGVVQAFAAEQAAVCEFMAALVAAERPASGRRVRLVLDRLAASRRAAPHVFEQLAACESAMTELWLLRFGEEL